MKRIFTLLTGIVFSIVFLSGQEAPPQAFSFKASISGSNGQPITNKTINLRISILQNDVNGLVVYSEIHSPTTNSSGLVDIEIGRGDYEMGDFDAIDWSADEYFLQIEVDPKQKSEYELLSITQLLSVPYALHAGNGFIPEYSEYDNRPVLGENGNVGIGMASHAVDAIKLNVNGSVGIHPGNFEWGSALFLSTDDLDGGASYLLGSLAGTAAEGQGKFLIRGWNDEVGDEAIFLMDLHGNVGLGGVLDPQYRLDVDGDINFTGSLYKEGNPFSVDYNDLSNLPDLSAYATKDMGNENITNLADPVNEQDAATKAYLDNLLAELGMVPNNFAGFLTDIEGNKYKTVQIGTQIWMAENLETGTYNDGTAIPTNVYGLEWEDYVTPAYCWIDQEPYGNLNPYVAYHKLYNWYAINTSKLCPADWHVSTLNDWTILIDYLGGQSVAGGKLKEAGTMHWYSPGAGANVVGTNESGFTAMPGSVRFSDMSSNRQYGQFWMSTEYNADEAWGTTLYYQGNGVSTGYWPKSAGRPVRCVKD